MLYSLEVILINKYWIINLPSPPTGITNEYFFVASLLQYPRTTVFAASLASSAVLVTNTFSSPTMFDAIDINCGVTDLAFMLSIIAVDPVC